MGFLSNLFGALSGSRGLGVDELARRLGASEDDLRRLRPAYKEFTLTKRSGGKRRIAAPGAELKAMQRRIARRLLGKLRAHPSAMGFEKGRSIVTNARLHAAKALVLQMDVKDFFDNTTSKRIQKYFSKIGWNSEAAKLLTTLVEHRGGLPQGAPTSPRLSNLLNYQLDERLAGLAKRHGAVYSRYADDLAFSWDLDQDSAVSAVIRGAKFILEDAGYEIHKRKKLQIRRRHQRQMVTGLVVNESVRLPRERRRWLRAVAHRLQTRGQCSLSADQLKGWQALVNMVSAQSRRAR